MSASIRTMAAYTSGAVVRSFKTTCTQSVGPDLFVGVQDSRGRKSVSSESWGFGNCDMLGFRVYEFRVWGFRGFRVWGLGVYGVLGF